MSFFYKGYDDRTTKCFVVVVVYLQFFFNFFCVLGCTHTNTN